MITFCWLPPDNRRASCSKFAARTSSRLRRSSVSSTVIGEAVGLPSERANARWMRVALSRSDCCISSASCLRSSDRRPTPAAIAARGRRGAMIRARDLHRSALERFVAGDRAAKLGLAGAFKACDPDDLARSHHEVDVHEAPIAGGANR